jgi:hypothetical protein
MKRAHLGSSRQASSLAPTSSCAAAARQTSRLFSGPEKALREDALREDALKEGALKEGALKEGALKEGLLKPTLWPKISNPCFNTNR